MTAARGNVPEEAGDTMPNSGAILSAKYLLFVIQKEKIYTHS